MRTNQEENRSRWLAQLLRDSSWQFTSKLFSDTGDRSLYLVRCERAYHDEDIHDRRVEIIALFEDRDISIEVKKGDENYE